MNRELKPNSRRKFIFMGIASAAVFSAFKFFKRAPKAPEEKQTVKMLSQDGKLVEVDVVALKGQKKKITNKELQNWVKR